MTDKDDNWVLAYSTTNELSSDLMIKSLEESGIKAVKMNKRDSIYHVGDIEVYVHLDDLCLAKTIVKEFEK